ncbi:phosphate transport system ATP-binding protein [Desulfitispora alkaliphila]|uniref:phosphate ABC transporter ATP-binding protein n=1 Tax=Desulfitispora alkaliphila TaxID=622674 RepID=UPI003D1F8F0D
MEPILSMKQVDVSYGKTQVLNQVTMNIRKNRITAIIGPSGCGKSTLLKTFNRMLEEEPGATVNGSICFQGTDISKVPREYIRQKIGLVFQTPTPFPFSVEKNMRYALDYHGLSGSRKASEIIEEKLRLAGLYHEVKDRMHLSATKLSGGQQQRLCIARALTLEPDVLLLDEPCSSLDPKATIQIEEALATLASRVTIVIVTHNLAQARRIAHDTAFICDGKLVEYSNSKDFFSNPKHSDTQAYLEGMFG